MSPPPPYLYKDWRTAAQEWRKDNARITICCWIWLIINIFSSLRNESHHVFSHILEKKLHILFYNYNQLYSFEELLWVEKFGKEEIRDIDENIVNEVKKHHKNIHKKMKQLEENQLSWTESIFSRGGGRRRVANRIIDDQGISLRQQTESLGNLDENAYWHMNKITMEIYQTQNATGLEDNMVEHVSEEEEEEESAMKLKLKLKEIHILEIWWNH